MQGRRVVFGLTVLNLVLAVWSLARPTRAAGGDPPDIVRARALELLDQGGQVRAQLNVEDGGEVVLRLRDANGGIRVKLGAGADGSGLLLLDGSAEPGIQMLAKESGASVTLASKEQKRVITPSPRS